MWLVGCWFAEQDKPTTCMLNQLYAGKTGIATSKLLVLFCTLTWGADITDYCDMLGEDDVQGKKHGFLTGNNVYYIGGLFCTQTLKENATIGLTHPFFHDLRSRCTGIAYHEGVGTGKDFHCWEFYKSTKILYGTIVTDEARWETPAPSRMFWRPEKMVVEYELKKPILEGEFEGWCEDLAEGSIDGTSHWINIAENECWDHCINDTACFQAVFEFGENVDDNECWIGTNKMTKEPTGNRCHMCDDRRFARSIHVTPFYIREEKFISSNNVVSTIITADRPVKLEFSGQSFDGQGLSGESHIISLNAECTFDMGSNSIHVIEGGKVMVTVIQKPLVEKEGVLPHFYLGTTKFSTLYSNIILTFKSLNCQQLSNKDAKEH
jgi:hypothetical protein